MAHWSWQTWIVLWIAMIFVLMLPFILRAFGRREICKFCYFPKHRCECRPSCSHDEKFAAIWSQDGYIAKCKRCGEILYLGDDFDAGA